MPRYGPYSLLFQQFGGTAFGLPYGRPLASTKGVGVPVTAIRQRDGAVIRDRAGNTIQIRS